MDWERELKGAGMLVKSGLVPKDIKTPEAALFVILAGRDLGLSPVQSLRSIRPIQGKIECSADLQLGLFHRDGGKSAFKRLDNKIAILELHAPWLAEPHLVKFGEEEAKRAGLMSNSNYAKYPQAMFRSRAITQGLKDIGYMMGTGLYAPGEIGGAAVVAIDGEVLPQTEETPDTGVTGVHMSTDGAVESLDDDERAALLRFAQEITEIVASGDMDAALAKADELAGDADKQAAVWALLDRDTKRDIKKARKEAKASEPPKRTVDDALKAIKANDMDLAADIASDLNERDKRFVEDEIEAALIGGQA
jgi:hypothetical protein